MVYLEFRGVDTGLVGMVRPQDLHALASTLIVSAQYGHLFVVLPLSARPSKTFGIGEIINAQTRKNGPNKKVFTIHPQPEYPLFEATLEPMTPDKIQITTNTTPSIVMFQSTILEQSPKQ